MSFEILISNSWTRIWLLKILHYLVFKEQNLREIISQNQVKWAIFYFKVASTELFEFFIRQPPSSYRVLSFLLLILHRKEVIHPHVLVGIPCYDFTPVTCPTLTGPLPYGLGYRLQVLQTPMAWRAVCTTPGNVFTPTFWFGITSDSNFMESSCRLQSELGPTLRDLLHIAVLRLVVSAIVARL